MTPLSGHELMHEDLRPLLLKSAKGRGMRNDETEPSDDLAAEPLLKLKQFLPRRTTKPTDALRASAAGPAPGADICAIGVSTGGPDALLEALPMLPRDFPLPIVIVQHMPPRFTLTLAQRLDAACAISVCEGVDGMILEPGRAVIAPGDFHMRVLRKGRELIVKMDQQPRENSCRPAVDVLFRSIAESLNGRAIAVVLTGMGQDGLAGARLLKARKASVLCQDEATSVVWGMPGAVASAHLADAILPLSRIVPEILQRIRHR